ncbi:Membrane-associating domain-containing protein [Cladophialophora immunda]|nr:Membrane-associating domain-containing protein [Cladophialophora immunda]
MPSGEGYSVVPVQRAFLPLRIIQMVFTVIVFGIACYHLSLAPNYDAGGISLFTALATIIFLIYWFVANSPANTNLYNYWAFFAVELFVLIFWLCTFALDADKVSLYVQATSYSYDGTDYSGDGTTSGSGSVCYDGVCVSYKRGLHYKRGLVKRSTDPISATLYVALALSVINFILFGVTFTLYTINMFRHRAALSNAKGSNIAMNNGHGAASRMEKGVVMNGHQ